MKELEQYVNSLFGADENDTSKIVNLFRPAKLGKGDYFTKAGGLGDNMGFIRSGFLRVYASAGDKEVTQWIGSKGYFMADMQSLTFNTPARWNIQALTDVDLYTIHKNEYDTIATHVSNWPNMEKQFIINCFLYMENRIFSLLSMSAVERYTAFFSQNKELFNQVPLQYIASMLGMTPETFSRIRKKQLPLSS